MNKIEIIICTERGYLEPMSKLLIYTLREFGGNLRDTPIYSYQPRKKHKISKETIAFFEKYQVEYIDINLNNKYHYYPLANKPLSCAHREMNTNGDILIFLDSDIFFLNEPTEFDDFNHSDVILRPVHKKYIGTENTGDKNADYWNELYNLLNVNIRRKIKTTVDNKDILEYYNSGHVATMAKNNLFNYWKENFMKVMEAGIKPTKQLFFVEQSVFAATVSQMELVVKQFSKNYNCPLHLQDQVKNGEYYITDFDKLISIHYHDIFKNRKGVNPIKEQLSKSENGRKVNILLSDFNIIQKENLSQIAIRNLKNKIGDIQQKLKLQ